VTQQNDRVTDLPWSDHHDILPWLELQQVEENVVARSNNNSGVALQLGRELLVKYARLDLVGYQDKQY